MQHQPELADLRAQLRTAGLFEHCELRSWLKLLFLLSCVAASVSWFVIEERFILAKRNFEFAPGQPPRQPVRAELTKP